MGSFFFFNHYSRVFIIFLILTGVTPAWAHTYAPLKTTSYLTVPIFLALYHFIYFVTNQSYKVNLILVFLGIATALTLSQPLEMHYLITLNEAYEQYAGFLVGLLMPVLISLTYFFFKETAKPENFIWLLVGGYVITVAAHILRYYTLYFSWAFFGGVIALSGIRIVQGFSAKNISHYLFLLGWINWLSILPAQLILNASYYEIPATLSLLLFSMAIFKQQREQIQLRQTTQLATLNQHIHTQEQTIHKQQETIHEKDKLIRFKEQRLKTNKEILEKAGRKLKEKERTLKLQNQQITQSIEYARNIQDAILPTEQAFKRFFKNYFVLFRPKDIVSGDFYWCSQITLEEVPTSSIANFVYQTNKLYTFVAAVDCTGHGVPGAFMSMIGNTLLNEIVNEKAIYTPSQILETLHMAIRSGLKQAYSGNTDGMDVCLCRMEKLANGKTEVLFAGAKRDLYCLNQNELKVISGDRKSIGGSQKESYRHFQSQSVILEKNDRMYLATDGLEDMAIGTKVRKSFGTKRLKAFIKKYAYMSLDDQYILLSKLVDKYKTNTEQRDDILVLGIQIL